MDSFRGVPGYNGDPDLNTAADEFLKMFTPPDAEKPSTEEQTPPPAKVDQQPEVVEAEADDESPPAEVEATEETEEPKRKYAEDDSYFKIKVGDEEHEVPAKDLRRLYGQEAALTQRSQLVAQERRRAEEETTKAVASLNTLLKRAQERAAPFKGLDFWNVARTYSAEDAQSLRQAATQAFEEENFLQNELDQFVRNIREQQETLLAKKAEEAVEQLTDPASPYYLEDWGDELYDELREFAVTNGLQKEIVDQIADASVWKLMHQAMLYQKGARNLVVTKKVDKTPKKIIKATKAPAHPQAQVAQDEVNRMNRLRRSGSTDDAAELFLARWANRQPME